MNEVERLRRLLTPASPADTGVVVADDAGQVVVATPTGPLLALSPSPGAVAPGDRVTVAAGRVVGRGSASVEVVVG